MKFWFEWMLAIHRAIWFPFNWTVGLERPPMAAPVDFSPMLQATERLAARKRQL
jgi:hypothetical protein